MRPHERLWCAVEFGYPVCEGERLTLDRGVDWPERGAEARSHFCQFSFIPAVFII